jgi:hypothetical protein
VFGGVCVCGGVVYIANVDMFRTLMARCLMGRVFFFAKSQIKIQQARGKTRQLAAPPPWSIGIFRHGAPNSHHVGSLKPYIHPLKPQCNVQRANGIKISLQLYTRCAALQLTHRRKQHAGLVCVPCFVIFRIRKKFRSNIRFIITFMNGVFLPFCAPPSATPGSDLIRRAFVWLSTQYPTENLLEKIR